MARVMIIPVGLEAIGTADPSRGAGAIAIAGLRGGGGVLTAALGGAVGLVVMDGFLSSRHSRVGAGLVAFIIITVMILWDMDGIRRHAGLKATPARTFIIVSISVPGPGDNLAGPL